MWHDPLHGIDRLDSLDSSILYEDKANLRPCSIVCNLVKLIDSDTTTYISHVSIARTTSERLLTSTVLYRYFWWMSSCS